MEKRSQLQVGLKVKKNAIEGSRILPLPQRLKSMFFGIFLKISFVFWNNNKIWDTADYQSTACSFPLRTSPEKFDSSQICGAFWAYSPTVTPWTQNNKICGFFGGHLRGWLDPQSPLYAPWYICISLITSNEASWKKIQYIVYILLKSPIPLQLKLK